MTKKEFLEYFRESLVSAIVCSDMSIDDDLVHWTFADCIERCSREKEITEHQRAKWTSPTLTKSEWIDVLKKAVMVARETQ